MPVKTPAGIDGCRMVGCPGPRRENTSHSESRVILTDYRVQSVETFLRFEIMKCYLVLYFMFISI